MLRKKDFHRRKNNAAQYSACALISVIMIFTFALSCVVCHIPLVTAKELQKVRRQGSNNENDEERHTGRYKNNHHPRGWRTRTQGRRGLFGQKLSEAGEGVGGAGGQVMGSQEYGQKRDPIAITWAPQVPPTFRPIALPPTPQPVTPPPTSPPAPAYQPGNLTHEEEGLLLSEGLTARLIAQAGRPVPYDTGFQSDATFHLYPDGGDTFIDIRPENPGGWVYVSNSEVFSDGRGCVGAITFNRLGNVVDYRRVLEFSNGNCGGGKTPWNTWISCEESGEPGHVWQVDPMGILEPQITTLGEGGGEFESFAYDIRNIFVPRFFVTEDESDGALRRFTPDRENINWGFPWDMLHGSGTMEYLVLQPFDGSETAGIYYWTFDKDEAEENAEAFYPKSEGCDVSGNKLFFVCKEVQHLFELDLDTNTYTRQSTSSGLFSAEPDTLTHILSSTGEMFLYFTEDGGFRNGIHGRNSRGEYFTVLESLEYVDDETTGVSFSPDGRHLYFAYQGRGLVFDVSRLDGLPFHASLVDLKYHSVDPGTQRASRKK